MTKQYRSNGSWASRQKQKSSRIIAFLKNFKNIRTWDKKMLIKNISLVAIALVLFGLILFLGLFAWVSRDLPDPNELSNRDVAQSTKIYDSSGEHLLYEIAGDEKRTLVPLDQIPDYLVQATITAEDRKFYEHNGIDLKGILRAVLVNVTTFDPTGQGASTITQQLVKNAILTTEQTYIRKMKEIILSLALERRYTKDEIIQLYLNEIPYGSTNYGIQSAAQAYFEKDVSDLTLAEAATLASLPKATTTLLNNPERLKERRDWILNSMEELGYITAEERDEALAEETPVTLNLQNITAPHFVLWVKEQLEEEYGERLVEQGGLKVITSLNYDYQQYAEEAIADNYEARSEIYGFNNSGLVALNPNNGHIVAMAGSADYFNDDIDGQVNVTLRPLQPGSSMKPIIYTAGFERGYTPNTLLWDVETTFPTETGNYSPRNYDLQEHGPVSIRKALQGSLNIPAVKMLALIGVESGLNFAERLHYTTFEDRSQFGLAIVLGGAEVKLLEHAAAYGTFATEGEYHEPVAILKVESPDGEVLQEWKEGNGERVIDKNIARMITNVLSDNEARAYAFGTGSYLQLGGRPVAAKTGTTNDYKDAWTMGYTPSLVAGVWTGNTGGQAMNRGAGGSTVAAPIWNSFMQKALSGTTVEGFTSPEIPTTGKAMLDGEIPAETVTIDSISGKLATEYTPERYREEKSCGEYHTILTYVNRSNPLGDIPSDPTKDFYYANWEAAVQNFLVRHNEDLEEGEVALEVCEIPTEEDDVHTPANEPTLRIREPDNNTSVGRSFDVTIKASAPRGIQRIEYAIDGSIILVDENRTGTTITLPSWVDAGKHELSVTAYDDVDNAKTESITIDVTEASAGTGYRITNPFNNQDIEKTADTYTIVLENSNPNDVDAVSMYATSVWTGDTMLITTIEKPGAFVSAEWTLPEDGDYILTVQTRLDAGDIVDSPPVRVRIMPGSVVEEIVEEVL